MSYRSKAPSIFLLGFAKAPGKCKLSGFTNCGNRLSPELAVSVCYHLGGAILTRLTEKNAESHGKEGHGIRRKKKPLVSTDMLPSYVSHQISWIRWSVSMGKLSPEEARQRYAALPLRAVAILWHRQH